MDNKKKNMKHYGLHLFFGEKMLLLASLEAMTLDPKQSNS